SSGVLVILQANGKWIATFFTDGRYEQQAKDEVAGARVQISQSNAMMASAEWLNARGTRLTVGFEADHMTVSMSASLGKAAPKLKFAPVVGLVEQLRAVKEAAEIAQIRAAGALASNVFAAILPDIRPGVTEASIAAQIEYMSRGLGAQGM